MDINDMSEREISPVTSVASNGLSEADGKRRISSKT